MLYQPILDLSSERPVGAEASGRGQAGSARREHARDDAVLPLACAAAAGWAEGTVAVNVSRRQLRNGLLLQRVGAALEASGLAPERLELELGEMILSDLDVETMLTLSVARDLGVGVVLDDFGTGLASLRMIKRLPLTGIKLAPSLVRDLPHDEDDAAIVRAVIGAARALGLAVAAAGIEREAQLAALMAYGCQLGQGTLFARGSGVAASLPGGG